MFLLYIWFWHYDSYTLRARTIAIWPINDKPATPRVNNVSSICVGTSTWPCPSVKAKIAAWQIPIVPKTKIMRAKCTSRIFLVIITMSDEQNKDDNARAVPIWKLKESLFIHQFDSHYSIIVCMCLCGFREMTQVFNSENLKSLFMTLGILMSLNLNLNAPLLHESEII